jgi:voltage-gated potassium channel
VITPSTSFFPYLSTTPQPDAALACRIRPAGPVDGTAQVRDRLLGVAVLELIGTARTASDHPGRAIATTLEPPSVRSHPDRTEEEVAVLGRARSYLERKFNRVLREPPTVGLATGVIVSATAVVILGSGLLMRLLDHSEYANIWVAMWWAAQTVTTVGYGDVSPAKPAGRIIGVFVMLYGVAFVTIFVAAITSIFVARATQRRGIAEDEAEQRIEAQLVVIDQRLARLDAIDERLAGLDGTDQRLDRIEALLRR